MTAEVGAKTPGFTLPADDRENTVSLEEYTERWPFALFYPGNRSSVCSYQMGKTQTEVEKPQEDPDEGL